MGLLFRGWAPRARLRDRSPAELPCRGRPSCAAVLCCRAVLPYRAAVPGCRAGLPVRATLLGCLRGLPSWGWPFWAGPLGLPAWAAFLCLTCWACSPHARSPALTRAARGLVLLACACLHVRTCMCTLAAHVLARVACGRSAARAHIHVTWQKQPSGPGTGPLGHLFTPLERAVAPELRLGEPPYARRSSFSRTCHVDRARRSPASRRASAPARLTDLGPGPAARSRRRARR